MSRHILLIAISFFCIFILFSSCEDETNSLVGTWDYTEIIISDCTDSNDNETTDYTGDGDCEILNNITRCTKLALVMTEETYTITRTVTLDGVEETPAPAPETGTYKEVDIAGSNIQFCTDVICFSGNYSISNGRLTLETTDLNTGCITNVLAVKR